MYVLVYVLYVERSEHVIVETIKVTYINVYDKS